MDSRAGCLDEHCVSAASASQNPDLHLNAPTIPMRVGELLPSFLPQLHVPPRHRTLRHLQKSSQIKGVVWVGISPCKGRNDLRWYRRFEDVGARAENGPRAQHRADSRLGVIAEKCSQKLLPGISQTRS